MASVRDHFYSGRRFDRTASANAATTRAKNAVLALGSVIIGMVVSFISGELLESWAYLVFDAAQVLIAAVATAVCVAIWRQRSQH